MVRSSMISIGAASEPARSSSAGSLASARLHAAGDLHAAAADLAADHRRGDHLALALLEQDDGHALADVLARHVAEHARALGVQRQVHRRLLGLVVEAGLGVGEVLAGEHHLALDDDRPAVALQVTLGAEGHRPAAALRPARLGAFVDQTHLQRGGAAEDVLGLGGVLHAGQLHHDAVQALLLDHGLGHAEFVDAVVQRGDVLLERLFLHPARGLGLERAGQLELGAVGASSATAGRATGPGQQSARALRGRRVAEAHVDGLCLRA